jgi:hypothetical protein
MQITENLIRLKDKVKDLITEVQMECTIKTLDLMLRKITPNHYL